MGKYKDKYVGTIGDLGVFSLNYHKHIHTGEGGVIISNNYDLIERCQLIRNHAENIVGPKELSDLTNMIGYNYRMTEIECAIGIEQLKKLPNLLHQRIDNVKFLSEHLSKFEALEFQPNYLSGSIHTYYVHPIKFKRDIAGVERDLFINAIKAELPTAFLRETTNLIGSGYVKPIYLQPIFSKRAAWAFDHPNVRRENLNYEKGLCPVTERMHYEELFTHEFMRPGMTNEDMLDVVDAFTKVFENIDELNNCKL
jgi:dTDP-4-amino-4,6-dideoxygalactose transaminase